MAHEPGPWTYWEDGCAYCREKGDRNLFIDGPSRTEHGGYSSEADARLISAAPDLLKELQEVLSELWEDRHSHQSRPDFERDFASAFAAIAKATSN